MAQFSGLGCSLQIHSEPQGNGPTTPLFLKCMLSYIAFARGDFFETGGGPEQNGHWVSAQLDRFRSAWLSFQQLARAEPILNDKTDKQLAGGWAHRYGLPRLVVLHCTVDYPVRKEVWEMIRIIPQWVVELPPKVCRGDDRWRRWAPGMPGTQTREGQSFTATRMVGVPFPTTAT